MFHPFRFNFSRNVHKMNRKKYVNAKNVLATIDCRINNKLNFTHFIKILGVAFIFMCCIFFFFFFISNNDWLLKTKEEYIFLISFLFLNLFLYQFHNIRWKKNILSSRFKHFFFLDFVTQTDYALIFELLCFIHHLYCYFRHFRLFIQ